MLAFLSGIFRRLLGGLAHGIPLLEKRWFQVVLLCLLYAPTIYFVSYHTTIAGLLPKWLFTIIATGLVVMAELQGHFPGFMCGTEDPAYIDEQLAKGRKIKFRKLVTWFGKIRGYEELGEEWCFWQLILCKTVFCIPAAILIGSQFAFAGLCTAFAYNAMFWVDMKNFKKVMTSPTNWGEFWQGCLFMWALLG